MEVGLGPGHIVLHGDSASLPKRGRASKPPIFGPFLLWPNGWMHQDATWYGGTPHPRRLCVRWGPSLSPSPKRGGAPQFSAHVYCCQTAAWIKMPRGTEIGLGPCVCVRWGPSSPRKRAHPPHPIFGPCLLWPNGWYGCRPRPRPRCIRWSPSCPRKGHSRPPLFGPCLLWSRSPTSATAEVLLENN